MSGLSKVIVVVPEAGGLDARAARQLKLGFEREGVPAEIASAVPTADTGLVVVSGSSTRALELLRKTRTALDAQQSTVPLVFAGGGVPRAEATAAGADEVVLMPTYLRDVVTIGRVLRAQPAGSRTVLVGSLAETTGVYSLVRALCALGRSAVLTLIRGLRRGEVRFFRGEVTSAQVGLIHGQAAFHQLLLWTEARFEFHHEDVVRRQQIPLTADELFTDAERFLEGVRDASGTLSPSDVLEQDVAAVHTMSHAAGTPIPTEVLGVLRMFDGHRVLADVLEDSPYRVFETLRVAQRAVEVGLLRIVAAQRPKKTWRAVLRIEEWLVGTGERPRVEETGPIARDTGPVARADTGPVAQTKSSSRKKRKKRRTSTAPPVAAAPPLPTAPRPEIDWGALVPRAIGAELAPLSGVVPAAHTSGEIVLPPTREAPREKLETLDTEKRALLFPKDAGLEPKVVLDEAADAKVIVDTSATDKPAADDAKTVAFTRADATDADDKAAADKAAAVKAAADKAAGEKAAADAIAVARTKTPPITPALLSTLPPIAPLDKPIEARTKTPTASLPPIAPLDKPIEARTKTPTASLPPIAPLDKPIEARTKTPIEPPRPKTPSNPPRAKAPTDPPRSSSPAITVPTIVPPTANAAEKAAADKAAADKAAAEKATADAAAEKAAADAAAEAKAKAEAKADAEDAKLRAEAAEWARQQQAARTKAAEDQAREDEELAKKLAAAKAKATSDEPRIVGTDEVTAEDTDDAEVWAAAKARAAEADAQDTSLTAAIARVSLDDEPESEARTKPPSTPPPIPQRKAPTKPPDDRPEARQGEIAPPREQRPTAEPAAEEPSILVADLAAAHVAVASIATAQAQAPATPNLASASGLMTVAEVRQNAQATIADAAPSFTDAEEAFFRAGQERPKSQPEFTAPVETFDDLDEGYQPVGFWDRLRGKKPTK